MKILVSSVNFAPDHAGIGIYSTDFPVYLAEQGHEVTMVTGFPYYPQWKKRKEDRRRLFSTEAYKGVRVLRGYLYVPQKVSTLKRLLHEASFCFFAGLNFFRAKKPDAIVIFTPPFFLGFVAVFISKIRRVPLVINIQDLPLDAAMALGMVKSSLLSKFMFSLESWIYRQADQVVSISESMLANVWAKGVDQSKTKLVPNWVDVASYSQASAKGAFLGGHPQVRNKLIIAYAGNLGVKQGVDILIHLAKRVEATPDYHFFIIGDGADKPRLLALADGMELKNVTFLPFMGPTEYRQMLTDVDLIFVAQRSGAGNNFFPSKLLGLMAQSKPLLIAADEDSELGRTVISGGFGLVSSYDDLDGLVGHLERYAKDDGFRASAGRKGLQAVQAFDRNTVLADWVQSIKALVR